MVMLMMIISCSDRPKEVLSEKKMVDLMIDMELTEAYTQQISTTNENRKKLGERVLASHGVSRETLDTTLAWYGRNLDEYAALFEKVDKGINKRKEKLIEIREENPTEYLNVWPYSSHIVLSDQSSNDALIFSLTNPGINRGEKVAFSFHLPNLNSGKGLLGVDYSDGTGEVMSTNFSSKPHVEFDFQSDSARIVERVYGTVLFKEREKYPVYLDSIKMSILPIDTLSYRQKRRSQKTFLL